jgi:hypothetical protein
MTHRKVGHNDGATPMSDGSGDEGGQLVGPRAPPVHGGS